MSNRNWPGKLITYGLTIVIGIAIAVFSNLPDKVVTAGKQAVAGESPEPTEPTVQHPFSGDGFVLSFKKNFKPGLASMDDLGLSVVIIVDTSGSMADPPAGGSKDPKYVQASKALTDIVDVLRGLKDSQSFSGMILKVGVLSFNSNVQQLFPMTAVNNESLGELRTLFANPKNLAPDAKTAIGLALERGTEMLMQSGTIMKSMIVVTDGDNTIGPNPKDVLWAINENRNSASTVDYPVSTRGILVSFVGFDIDAGLFTPLADQGARVTAAADQNELQKELRKVLVADATLLEAKN